MGRDIQDFSPEAIQAQLSEIKSSGLYRSREALSGPQAATIGIEEHTLLNFCSNDYLGLANDPRLVQSMCEAVKRFGVGSGASPLVCGWSVAHRDLETQLAEFCQRDRALIFSSGYLANLAISATLAPAREDCIYQDKLNHASIIDAARLSPARLRRFPHGDTQRLQELVDQPHGGRKLVVTDAVFSMDGDIARLADIAEIAKKSGACLVVDDAHGFGVLGHNGAGTLQQLGLGQHEAPLMVATFGKALGCSGAFVAGRADLIELMLQKARPYIYSTAIPSALAAVVSTSLDIVQQEGWRRQRLQQLAQVYEDGIAEMGLPPGSGSPVIKPLIVGSSDEALKLSQALREEGVLVTAIRPPTVPANTARLRVTLSAAHEQGDVQKLLSAIGRRMTN